MGDWRLWFALGAAFLLTMAALMYLPGMLGAGR